MKSLWRQPTTQQHLGSNGRLLLTSATQMLLERFHKVTLSLLRLGLVTFTQNEK